MHKDTKFQRLAKDFLYVTIVNCLDMVSVSPVVERANDATAQVCIFIKLTLALTCCCLHDLRIGSNGSEIRWSLELRNAREIFDGSLKFF